MSDAYEKNMYSQARKNIVRTWIIVTIFTAVVAALGYAVAVYYNNISIVVASVIGALAGNVSSYFFSEKIAISSSGAVPADPRIPEHKRLIQTVETMSIAAGIPAPKVHVINDSAPNAFATGRNPKHASVAFTTGILKLLDKNELEGVVAHELSHIKNRDILVGTIVVVMIGFVAILADMFMRSGLTSQRRSSEGGPAAGVIVLVIVLFAVLSPIIGKLIQTAVSRKREYLADASGAMLTRYPEGLASALAKISGHTMPLKKTSQATSHLFIANPFGDKGSIGQFMKNIFSTHPPMEKRIEALLGEDMKNEMLGIDDRAKELREKP